jgi:hypothetical protein
MFRLHEFSLLPLTITCEIHGNDYGVQRSSLCHILQQMDSRPSVTSRTLLSPFLREFQMNHPGSEASVSLHGKADEIAIVTINMV